MFHVPAFFVLTGFLWRESKQDERVLSILGNFTARKFRRLMVPYFVFGIASLVIYCLVVDKNFDSFGVKVLSLLHGGGWGGAFKANFVLWFLPVMFTVTVIYKVIDVMVDWEKRWWAHLLLAMGCLYVHRFCVYRLGVNGFPVGFALAMRYLSYLVLSRLAARVIATCKIRVSGKVCAVLGAAVFAVLTFFDKEACIALVGDWVSWIIIVVGGVLMSLSFMAMLKPFDSRILRLAGQNSLGIMLMHKFVVVALESNSIKPFMAWNFCNGVFGVIFVTAMAATVTMVASICICKMCPVLLGISTER